MGERPHFRIGRREPVALRLRFSRAGSALRHEATTRDISVAGAFVASRRAPAVGAELDIEIASPSAWDPLVVRAVVRWVATDGAAEPGFGVEFAAISPAEARALEELLGTAGFGGEGA